MICVERARAAPTGLGTIHLDVVCYRHVTPTGFVIRRCLRSSLVGM